MNTLQENQVWGTYRRQINENFAEIEGQLGSGGETTPPSQIITAKPNLLINSSFRVWQRAVSASNPTNSYVADRMKMTSTGTVSRTTPNGGMTLSGNANLRYIMEDLDFADVARADDTFTLSCLKDNNIMKETYPIDKFSAVTGGRIVVDIDLSAGNIEWIKLELGDTATQFIPRHISEELSLCQRYFQLVSGYSRFNIVIADANVVVANIPISNSLRVNPSLSRAMDYGILDANGSSQVGFDITAITNKHGFVEVVLRKTDHQLTAGSYILTIDGWLDAEL